MNTTHHNLTTMLATSLAAAALAACGGGGSSGTTPDPSALIAVAPCATGYKSITIDNSSVAGAQMSIVVANATLEFSTLTGYTQPSLQICMGQPAQALSQAGFYTLSETYELQATPLNMLSAGIQNLNRTLTVQFALTGLPAAELAGLQNGSSTVALINKIRVFMPDASGVWQPMSQSSFTLAMTTPTTATSKVVVSPDYSGKFVVAYKP